MCTQLYCEQTQLWPVKSVTRQNCDWQLKTRHLTVPQTKLLLVTRHNCNNQKTVTSDINCDWQLWPDTLGCGFRNTNQTVFPNSELQTTMTRHNCIRPEPPTLHPDKWPDTTEWPDTTLSQTQLYCDSDTTVTRHNCVQTTVFRHNCDRRTQLEPRPLTYDTTSVQLTETRHNYDH